MRWSLIRVIMVSAIRCSGLPTAPSGADFHLLDGGLKIFIHPWKNRPLPNSSGRDSFSAPSSKCWEQSLMTVQKHGYAIDPIDPNPGIVPPLL